MLVSRADEDQTRLPPERTSHVNRSIPLVLAVALFMEQMDSTVIATALPAIAADIDTSPISLKLALTAYLVSLAVFIPISGFMADRFGARDIRWYLWIPAILTFMIVPVLIIALTSGSARTALLLTGPFNFLTAAYLGSVIAVSHSLVSIRMRALTSAILFFILNLIGLGLGKMQKVVERQDTPEVRGAIAKIPHLVTVVD